MDAQLIDRTARAAVAALNVPAPLADYREDLVQAAALGAWRAAAIADPTKGDPAQYIARAARRAAMDAIRTELRARGLAVGDTKARKPHAPDAWARAVKRLAARPGVPSTEPDAGNTQPLARSRANRGEGGDLPPDPYLLADAASAGAATPPLDLEHAELISRLPQYLTQLARTDKRGARVLWSRYLDGRTQQQVATSERITQQAVSAIEARALAAMRDAIEGRDARG